MDPITVSKFGFCKCKFTPRDNQTNVFSYPANWTTPIDIEQGRGVNFSFTYEWTANNECIIRNIKWQAGKILYSANGSRSFYYCGLGRPANSDRSATISQDFFTQSQKLTISFNNSSLSSLGENYTRLTVINSALNDNNNGTITASNSSGAALTKTISSVQTKYIVANFKYEYTETINDDPNVSAVTYLVEINNIKIPKTSKYEHNVVFTEAGVEELVGSLVHKTGDTMTGDLFIKSTSPDIILKNMNMNTTVSSIPVTGDNNGYYSALIFRDKNDTTHNIGYIQAAQEKNSVTNNSFNWDGNAPDADQFHAWTRICTRIVNANTGKDLSNTLTLHAYRDGIVKVGFSHPAAWREGLNVVNKSGDTMTGNLTVKKSTPTISSESALTGHHVSLYISSDLQIHGIYSNGYVTDTNKSNNNYTAEGKWLVYRNKNGDVILNGTATEANKLTTAHEIYVDLGTTRNTNSKVTFDGSADKAIHVSGTLPITRGGTGANNAATALSNLDGQTKHLTKTILISFSNSTSADVNVAGITESNTVFVSPIPSAWSYWRDNGIRCSAQAAGKLTFTADEAITGNTSANIVVFNGPSPLS